MFLASEGEQSFLWKDSFFQYVCAVDCQYSAVLGCHCNSTIMCTSNSVLHCDLPQYVHKQFGAALRPSSICAQAIQCCTVTFLDMCTNNSVLHCDLPHARAISTDFNEVLHFVFEALLLIISQFLSKGGEFVSRILHSRSSLLAFVETAPFCLIINRPIIDCFYLASISISSRIYFPRLASFLRQQT